MSDKNKILSLIENDIKNLRIEDSEKDVLISKFEILKKQPVNIMITGATGCGKSSTINALFGREVATVGSTAKPETQKITSYTLGNLVLWDNPGLGDGKEADKTNSEQLINKLKEVDADGNYVIDLVLVVLDGSTKDLGTSYDLINNIVIPNLGESEQSRILVAINQADVAMKGRYWNYEKNKPEKPLLNFLDDKVVSIRERIKEATGVDITPIYYCAGFKEEGEQQSAPYNLSKLIYYIIKYIPEHKRIAFANEILKTQNVKRKSILDELNELLS